jgi:hypothetical protein
MSRKSPKLFVPSKQSLLDWIHAVDWQKADEKLLNGATGKSSTPLPRIPIQFNKPKPRRVEIFNNLRVCERPLSDPPISPP